MSLSGSIAMAVLRLVKPGRGSFTDVEKSRRKAEKENAAFTFSMPKSKKADLALLPETEKPCLIIRPHRRKNADKAILYIYGGVTNQWKTQKSMAISYAAAAGTEVWYPVYPAVTEVSLEETVAYLADIYRKMTERFSPDKIVLSGVSMGGFFALQIINYINQRMPDIPMPGLVLAHSPGGMPDNERDWKRMRKYARRDPLFSEGDLRVLEELIPHQETFPGWLLYPARGDFRNAPPTYLYYGEEMLAGNAAFYRRAFKRSGAADRLHIQITRNMMHGYSCMPVFPESKKSYGETLELIRRL
ncbi:MAG: alpha/beta hydrolase [Eubacterium sp.]|nr:alpha/beta hydrolase [Eubacterium sp.]